mgnify:CR=1 FL=1
MKLSSAVVIVFILLIYSIFLIMLGKRTYFFKYNKMQKNVKKFSTYYYLSDYWLELKQNNRNLGEYFDNIGVNKIVIYGYGSMGKSLCRELINQKVEIAFIIDKDLDYCDEFRVGSISDIKNESVEMVVVTAPFAYQSIRSSLIKEVKCPIISIEDIIFSL